MQGKMKKNKTVNHKGTVMFKFAGENAMIAKSFF